MKILLIIFSILLINSCSQRSYIYPNYAIIKPKKSCTPKRKNIQALLNSYLGKPYVWAEEGPDAFDCSGLTYNIYGSMGMDIPRVARNQAKMGQKIRFKNLYYGDLIFFGSPNKRSKYINHVGIYLGKGRFAHASSKYRKVVITYFAKEPIYRKRIKVCRRYLTPNERGRYMNCDVPLRKLKTTTTAYTSPWKTGMRLPRKAVP